MALVVAETMVAALLPPASAGQPQGVLQPLGQPPKEHAATRKPTPVLPSSLPLAGQTSFLQVTPQRGGVLELGGVCLEVPAGAVDRPLRISVTRLLAPPPLNPGLANVTSGGGAYRFEPHGQRFNLPVRVSLPFDPALPGSETALSNLFTYFYNERQRRWERLQRVALDREGCRLTSLTDHFTDLLNATLELPEGPAPILFDMNSIKSLQAGDPAEGVPMPEGLQPGPYGAASFRIPLRLPPGRGGASPDLVLQYSSDSLNSWLGRGFDIPISEVGTDTRFGLPRYEETDTCLLDGEELILVGSDGGELEYRARTERTFRRIRRFRGAGEDRWEVTSKNGEVREYGGREGWLGPDRTHRERTYRWYLSRMRDVFGNTVEYEYWHDENGCRTYPREIRYTGHEGQGAYEPGAYRIVFELEDRPDHRSDARGRFLCTMRKRLHRVDVFFGEERVRTYLLEYLSNEFGQSVLARFSEVDGQGTPFYAYAFDYHGLTERRSSGGELEGYEGFEPETSWRAVYDEESKGLHDTRSASAGGSLYTGVELFVWLPFLGKHTIASFGVSGGINFSTSATRGTLLDLNGDGLADAVWKDGKALAGYLNRGDGFEMSSIFRLPGLEDHLDLESQSSFTIGVSGGLGPLHGGVAVQRSWSEAKTSFADVNGDGFLDFLQAGQSSFGRNTGNELVPTSWQMAQVPNTGFKGERVGGAEVAEQQRAYYRQEPLRCWKAYRTGTLVVSQTARLSLPEEVSTDGLALRTYCRAGATALVLDRMHPEEEDVSRYPIQENDSLFFRMDTGEQELGDEAEWSVRLRYTKVDFFEELSKGALFQPLEKCVGSPPYGGDQRLRPIYRQAGDVYTLKAGWQALEQAIVSPACEALVEHGAFVPRRLSRELFEKLYAAASAHSEETLTVPDPVGTGGLVSVSLPRLLLEGYGYVAEKRCFLRLNGYADQAVKRCLPVLSLEERRQAAFVRWLDGMLVAPRQEGTGFLYSASAPLAELEAAILADAGQAVPGCSVMEAGILLDELWEQAEDPEPAERLWLQREVNTTWRLYRAGADGESERSLTVSGEDPLEVIFLDDGVERRFRLSGRTSLLRRLPAAVFNGVVSEKVLRGEVFSVDGCTPISEATWPALLGHLNPAEQEILSSCYALSDGAYRRVEGLSAAATASALRVLDTATRISGSVFAAFPGDPSPAKRLVFLSEEELVRFAAGYETAGGGSALEITGLFACVSDSEGKGYYLLPNSGEDERARLLQAMQWFRRDSELFPYYQRNPMTADWRLKADVSETQAARVSLILAACGLEAWTGFHRQLTYRAGSLLPVEAGLLPPGVVEEQWAPCGSMSVEAGRETGVVRIPLFGASHRAVRVPRYVHVFDSGLDYSAEDLVLHPEEYRYADSRGVFGGGVYGWFYGVWIGYHPWDEALLTAQDAPPVQPGESDPPPYFELMRPNTAAGGAAAIDRDGTGRAVSADAWIGSVSAYSDTSLDSQYQPVTEERKFAAFITGNRLHPSRNGGDAYYRIPRSGLAGVSGELPFIRNARSKATDVNGGISLLSLGGDFSSCQGESWQYRALLDMDGDRLPDAIRLADDAESSSILVASGTGRGFADEHSCSSPFSRLSGYQNRSFGFGGSLGSASGATKQQCRSGGKVSSTTVQEAQAGWGLSLGVNGTLASSVQILGLLDVNGDGLPDHLSRDGSGDFLVALNTGNTSFSSPESWGAGITMHVFGSFGELPTATQGLSHSCTGSFGASAGVSISAGLAGAGASAGFIGTVSQNFTTLEDVNGDGLADQVAKHMDENCFRVRFNLGDRFAETETRLFRPDWGFGDAEVLRAAIVSDLSSLAGLLGGLSLPIGCGIPGFAGLPDSTENRFRDQVNPFGIADVLDYTAGTSFNLGANLTFSIMPAPLVALTLTPGINGSVASASTTLRFADIDGDGLPDHVAKLPHEDFLRVKRNAAGKAGLLKTIHLPLGGTWELDYERAGNTVALPQCRWVLSRFTRDDGLGSSVSDRGEHRYQESYHYEDGFYDRAERLFYGFARVTSEYADGTQEVVNYHNREWHTRGMVRGSELWGFHEGSGNRRYRETETVVQPRSEGWYSGKEVVFPAVSCETMREFEPGSERCVQRRVIYEYDEYGNIARLEDQGDTSREGDELFARCDYAALPGYLKQHPSKLWVEGAGGELLRLREGQYGERGELHRMHRYESSSQKAAYTLSWDAYGNLAAVEDPGGFRLRWEYDSKVHSHPSKVRSDNARRGGAVYLSSIVWDYRLGKELERMDLNGQRMRFRYDSHGRLIEVWSPYDGDSTPAVRIERLTGESPWRAATHNKLRYDLQDTETLVTVVSKDGLGRVAQTAKEAELWDGGESRQGWTCSGALAFDGKCRVVAEGQPVFVEGADLPGLVPMRRPASRTYDAQDRLTETVLPDGARMRTRYLVSEGQAVQRSLDPLGNVTERRLDCRGNILAISRFDAAAVPLTGASYRYNALGEILEAIDLAGNTIRSIYDLRGRRTSLECPDSGLIEYRYDESGNLIRKIDANLRRRGEAISYSYDGHNRLEKIEYPQSGDVQLAYGPPEAADFGAGRLVERRDESGRVVYKYGRLGELSGISRSIERLTPAAPAIEASFEYLHDYLGRMQRIRYPDGEEVSYEYDRGGQVCRVSGRHYGRQTSYVKQIGYDEFGQRTYIEFGNGVRSSYTYDENRRWLDSIHTESRYGAVLQSMIYHFDPVGNVLELANRAESYETVQNYGYDDLYQLTQAQGSHTEHPYGFSESSSTYSQQFTYDAIGNMTGKASRSQSNPRLPAGSSLNYLLDYRYYSGKPHQAERIGEMWYRYDANGNLVEEREGGHSAIPLGEAELRRLGEVRVVNRGFGLTVDAPESVKGYSRYYVWDEENRLKRCVESERTVDFRYGADGQRAVKYSAQGETLYFDALWQLTTDFPDLRCSKHIFLGTSRIATRLNFVGFPDSGYEETNTYTYHPDHLGSVKIVTDVRGGVYERLEYAPYGELWIEQQQESQKKIPFLFTGKEMDAETGLYYFGARYLDSRSSRWISPDPAMERYLPEAPLSEVARLRNLDLPGEGGAFMQRNLSVYHYSMDNPLAHKDPNGAAGQNETAPFDFPVLHYLELFEKAGYRERSRPTISDAYSNSQQKMFKAVVKVGPLELLGRILSIGIVETDRENLSVSKAEAITQMFSNILDPDVPVAISAWIQTDNRKVNIVNWSLSLTMLEIDTSIETTGSRTGRWQPLIIESKETALRVLMANPDLMYRLMSQTGLLTK